MSKNNQSVNTDLSNEAAAISRGDFMRSLGLSSAALMAFYCMGTSLISCKKDTDTNSVTPTPSSGITGTTTGSSVNFTVDLTNSSVSSLKTGTPLKVGDVFIAKAKSGYVALQRLCTHQGQDALTYNATNDNVVCTSHGSVFSTSGAVVQGPAGSALKKYTATLSSDGNTLTIRA